jgi:riboflavin synthase
MFTGIIEEVGRVLGVAPGPQASELRLDTALDPGPIGASLAVEGVCLTVTAHRGREVTATVGPETLAVTTLASLRPGDRVNLERPLRLGDRLGGHLVAGHVDGVGELRASRMVGPARELWIGAPESVLRYVVAKGSIAVDGISLTVNELGDGRLSVMLIPHTLAHTTLVDKGVGARLNLEADLIGKYVERLLAPRPSATAPRDIDLDFLARHGYT